VVQVRYSFTKELSWGPARRSKEEKFLTVEIRRAVMASRDMLLKTSKCETFH
jgi:hypothetical protein